jgi:hypothetical protein
MQMSSTSDDIGRGDLAAPAVAGLAAYLMSLDQYRTRLQVPGSVARNVRDLIKSLAYARLPLQPAVVWNGIDSRQHPCPAAARRDAGSPGCPAPNTTTPSVPPHQTTPSHPTLRIFICTPPRCDTDLRRPVIALRSGLIPPTWTSSVDF